MATYRIQPPKLFSRNDFTPLSTPSAPVGESITLHNGAHRFVGPIIADLSGTEVTYELNANSGAPEWVGDYPYSVEVPWAESALDDGCVHLLLNDVHFRNEEGLDGEWKLTIPVMEMLNNASRLIRAERNRLATVESGVVEVWESVTAEEAAIAQAVCKCHAPTLVLSMKPRDKINLLAAKEDIDWLSSLGIWIKPEHFLC